jgi:pilus assembly protein CpaE
VGKTSVSKELAAYFSSSKIHKKPCKVCLVDLDVEFGDLAPILQLAPYPNISFWAADIMNELNYRTEENVVYAPERIKSSFIIRHELGFDVIAAPNEYHEKLAYSGQVVRIMINNLKNCGYDLIILDTGSNTKDASLTAIEESDLSLLVVTLEINSIRNAKMMLSALDEIGFDMDKFRLIINRISSYDSDINTGEINQTLGITTIAQIPEHNKLRIINNQGEFAVLKKNEFSKAIKNLAKEVYPN